MIIFGGLTFDLRERTLKDVIDDALGEVLDFLAVFRVQLGQGSERFRELPFANFVEFFGQRDDGRFRDEALEPAPELVDALIDDFEAAIDFVAACFEVFFGDFLEVVDVV